MYIYNVFVLLINASLYKRNTFFSINMEFCMDIWQYCENDMSQTWE